MCLEIIVVLITLWKYNLPSMRLKLKPGERLQAYRSYC